MFSTVEEFRGENHVSPRWRTRHGRFNESWRLRKLVIDCVRVTRVRVSTLCRVRCVHVRTCISANKTGERFLFIVVRLYICARGVLSGSFDYG